MDFDPRDIDSRDDERYGGDRERGSRGGSDDECDDEWSRPAALSRDRDDEGRDLGRGPGDSRESHSDERGRDARDDARWPERDRDDYDGHPDRTAEEIREWALEHDLPYFDDEVHFPDLRIEYELDGRLEHRDIEVTTEHYRGAHGASVAKSGFSCYRGSSARIGGGSSRGGGSPFDPDVAEEFV